VKDNVIECLNEVFLITVSAFLIPMQYKETRGDEVAMVMIYLVLANGIVVTFIIIF
jgi:hypothetical protein